MPAGRVLIGQQTKARPALQLSQGGVILERVCQFTVKFIPPFVSSGCRKTFRRQLLRIEDFFLPHRRLKSRFHLAASTFLPWPRLVTADWNSPVCSAMFTGNFVNTGLRPHFLTVISPSQAVPISIRFENRNADRRRSRQEFTVAARSPVLSPGREPARGSSARRPSHNLTTPRRG